MIPKSATLYEDLSNLSRLLLIVYYNEFVVAGDILVERSMWSIVLGKPAWCRLVTDLIESNKSASPHFIIQEILK